MPTLEIRTQVAGGFSYAFSVKEAMQQVLREAGLSTESGSGFLYVPTGKPADVVVRTCPEARIDQVDVLLGLMARVTGQLNFQVSEIGEDGNRVGDMHVYQGVIRDDQI